MEILEIWVEQWKYWQNDGNISRTEKILVNRGNIGKTVEISVKQWKYW